MVALDQESGPVCILPVASRYCIVYVSKRTASSKCGLCACSIARLLQSNHLFGTTRYGIAAAAAGHTAYETWRRIYDQSTDTKMWDDSNVLHRKSCVPSWWNWKRTWATSFNWYGFDNMEHNVISLWIVVESNNKTIRRARAYFIFLFFALVLFFFSHSFLHEPRCAICNNND